jgi:hypothetical protein
MSYLMWGWLRVKIAYAIYYLPRSEICAYKANGDLEQNYLLSAEVSNSRHLFIIKLLCLGLSIVLGQA